MRSLKPAVAGLFFLVGIVAIDRLIGVALDRSRDYASERGYQDPVDWSLDRHGSDVLIFGSSRAKHHLDPSVLGPSLGLRVANLGANGQEINYSLMLEILFLKRPNQPKIFVIQVDPKELYSPEPRRALTMAPYYGRDERVDELLRATSKYGWLKLQLRTYRYNGKLIPLAQNVLKRPSVKPGFVPLDGELDHYPVAGGPGRLAEGPDLPTIINSQAALFEEFIGRAHERDIRVFLILGPRLRATTPGPGSRYRAAVERFESIARDAGARFLELSEETDPVFRDPSLFRDASHLNRRGAEILSEKLAAAILEAPDSAAP